MHVHRWQGACSSLPLHRLCILCSSLHVAGTPASGSPLLYPTYQSAWMYVTDAGSHISCPPSRSPSGPVVLTRSGHHDRTSCIPHPFFSSTCCHNIPFDHISSHTVMYSASRAHKSPLAPGRDEAISGSQASYVILSGPSHPGLLLCSPQGQRQDPPICGFCIDVRVPRHRKDRRVQAVVRTWQLRRHLPKSAHPVCIGLNVITGALESP